MNGYVEVNIDNFHITLELDYNYFVEASELYARYLGCGGKRTYWDYLVEIERISGGKLDFSSCIMPEVFNRMSEFSRNYWNFRAIKEFPNDLNKVLRDD